LGERRIGGRSRVSKKIGMDEGDAAAKSCRESSRQPLVKKRLPGRKNRWQKNLEQQNAEKQEGLGENALVFYSGRSKDCGAGTGTLAESSSTTRARKRGDLRFITKRGDEYKTRSLLPKPVGVIRRKREGGMGWQKASAWRGLKKKREIGDMGRRTSEQNESKGG